MTYSSYLVTGGSGSLGTAIVELLLKTKAKKIIIYSRDEFKQHEMKLKYNNDRLRFFIGDIRDYDRLYRAFKEVDCVIHTAAMKQITSCEFNPFEAVETNIIGSKNIIDAAINAKVKKVIAISSDKAASPSNLYGATKLCSEKLFIDGNVYSGDKGTKFSCIRFGNFIGSRGSVIPIWENSKDALPITHKDMTRYWIEKDVAAKFCLDMLEIMEGREIFIPKMDKIPIAEMARRYSLLPFKEIGIRKGEKMHEILFNDTEFPEDKNKYWVIK